MAISEGSMIDAEILAIEEINREGGVLGRKLDYAFADTASDWSTAAAQAERLITVEKVSAVVGCWTSACRKTILPVFEAHDHLLLYPMAYEGLEASPYVVYTGAAPNQQIIPAVHWSFEKLGKRFFFVGSDYVWPRSVNAIVKDELKALGAELVGEEYIPFGSSDVDTAVRHIAEVRPSVVFSMVVGESNIAFYEGLREAHVRPDQIPVLSVSIGENELRALPVEDMVGNYSAWNYFQSIARRENRDFVARFKRRYGADRVTSDVIEASYVSVKLWAQAVNEGKSADPAAVRRVVVHQSLDAPEGVVSVDPETQHCWRSFSIGRIRADGQFDLEWTSNKPMRPVPYPISRTREAWEAFLSNMYTGWGGSWANPVKKD
jgi:urea transport system substrate-binding protein